MQPLLLQVGADTHHRASPLPLHLPSPTMTKPIYTMYTAQPPQTVPPPPLPYRPRPQHSIIYSRNRCHTTHHIPPYSFHHHPTTTTLRTLF